MWGHLGLHGGARNLTLVRAGDSLVWRLDEDGRLVVEPRRTSTLADVRAAIAAAGVPAPPRAFTNAERDEATGQALNGSQQKLVLWIA